MSKPLHCKPQTWFVSSNATMFYWHKKDGTDGMYITYWIPQMLLLALSFHPSFSPASFLFLLLRGGGYTTYALLNLPLIYTLIILRLLFAVLPVNHILNWASMLFQFVIWLLVNMLINTGSYLVLTISLYQKVSNNINLW